MDAVEMAVVHHATGFDTGLPEDESRTQKAGTLGPCMEKAVVPHTVGWKTLRARRAQENFMVNVLGY
jgi:hypothetical protein